MYNHPICVDILTFSVLLLWQIDASRCPCTYTRMSMVIIIVQFSECICTCVQYVCQLLGCTCAFLLAFISEKSRASAVSVGWCHPSFQGLWLTANFTRATGITNSFDLCSIAVCSFSTHTYMHIHNWSLCVHNYCSSAVQLLRMEQVILRGHHPQLITSVMFPLQPVLPIFSNLLPNHVSTTPCTPCTHPSNSDWPYRDA